MTDSRVLVAGATGQLGRVITRQLLDSGVKVRALARNAGALARVRAAGRDRRGGHARPAEAHRGLSRRRPDRRHRQQQHGPGHEQPVPHRSRRLPEPLRRGAQHRRAPAGLRLVSRRRAGRAGRHLPHQVVHRGRHPPERHPVGDAPADLVHGHLDRPDRRQGDSRQGRGDDLRRWQRASPTTSRSRMWRSSRSRSWRGRRSSTRRSTSAARPTCRRTIVATIVERRFKSRGKRRHIPVAAMRLLAPIVKPFNEVAARMMTLGLYSATEARPFPDGRRPRSDSVSPRDRWRLTSSR